MFAFLTALTLSFNNAMEKNVIESMAQLNIHLIKRPLKSHKQSLDSSSCSNYSECQTVFTLYNFKIMLQGLFIKSPLSSKAAIL